MSGGFAVDLELLAELIDRMARTGAQLTVAEEDVDARMTRVHATWQGQAATLHTEAHRRWVTGARQMREALEDLRAVAQTADANYTSAAGANARMWAL